MATVTEPIALDKSLNTTEASPRNLADVLAEGIGDLVSAISQIAPQTTYDELDKLNDVQITSATSGQVLKWNGSKWVNANESGGSGGHTIEDSTGTALTQRTNLQFDDLSVTDDSVNDATVVSASGKADKTNLSTISATGSTNNTGSTIKAGTYFYLDGVLKRAKTDISNGASFTASNMESGDNALNGYNNFTFLTIVSSTATIDVGISAVYNEVMIDCCYENMGRHYPLIFPRDIFKSTNLEKGVNINTDAGDCFFAYTTTQMKAHTLPTNYKIKVYAR